MRYSSGSAAGQSPTPVPWGLRRERNSSAPKPPSRGLVLVLALAPLCASSQPVITLGPAGEVAVEASLSPIGDVLERFARVTGAQLTWDGEPPRQLVTLRVQAASAAAALAALLEGQALDYAVALDATGSRVTTLIIGAQAASGRPTMSRGAAAPPPLGASSPRGDPRRPPPQREAEPEPEPEPESEPPLEEPAAEAVAPANPGDNRPDREGPAAAPSPEGAATPSPFAPVAPQRYPSPFGPQARPGQPALPAFPLATPSPTP